MDRKCPLRRVFQIRFSSEKCDGQSLVESFVPIQSIGRVTNICKGDLNRDFPNLLQYRNAHARNNGSKWKLKCKQIRDGAYICGWSIAQSVPYDVLKSGKRLRWHMQYNIRYYYHAFYLSDAFVYNVSCPTSILNSQCQCTVRAYRSESRVDWSSCWNKNLIYIIQSILH